MSVTNGRLNQQFIILGWDYPCLNTDVGFYAMKWAFFYNCLYNSLVENSLISIEKKKKSSTIIASKIWSRPGSFYRSLLKKLEYGLVTFLSSRGKFGSIPRMLQKRVCVVSILINGSDSLAFVDYQVITLSLFGKKVLDQLITRYRLFVFRFVC